MKDKLADSRLDYHRPGQHHHHQQQQQQHQPERREHQCSSSPSDVTSSDSRRIASRNQNQRRVRSILNRQFQSAAQACRERIDASRRQVARSRNEVAELGSELSSIEGRLDEVTSALRGPLADAIAEVKSDVEVDRYLERIVETLEQYGREIRLVIYYIDPKTGQRHIPVRSRPLQSENSRARSLKQPWQEKLSTAQTMKTPEVEAGLCPGQLRRLSIDGAVNEEKTSAGRCPFSRRAVKNPTKTSTSGLHDDVEKTRAELGLSRDARQQGSDGTLVAAAPPKRAGDEEFEQHADLTSRRNNLCRRCDSDTCLVTSVV